jgi:predicted secreted hydrolase
LLQGPNGYSRKSATESAASHYYSITRLDTRGRVTVPGEWMNATEFEHANGSAGTKPRGATFDVTGLSWMDHEFSSNHLGQSQVGWDWFALQLYDGVDVMLYMLRDATGIDYAHGTLLKRDGSVEWLEPGDWSLETREEHGGYPSSWSLRIADRDLEIVPLALDQENVSAIIPGLRYWEGAVELHADGKRAGQGYVELTGYGDSGRLPF